MSPFIAGPARRNALGSLVINGSLRVSRLVAIVVSAAVLSPASFAALAVAFALTDLVRGALQAFDIDGVRRVARGESAAHVTRACLSGKALAAPAGLLMVAPIGALLDTPGAPALIAILGVGVLAGTASATFLVERQSTLTLHLTSARVALASMGTVVLALLALWSVGTPASVAVALTIGDGLLLLLTRPTLVGGLSARLGLAQCLRAGPLVVIQLAHFGQFRVGTIALAALGSAVAVGEYTVASRLMEGLIILAMALSSSSLPLMGLAHARAARDGLTRVFEGTYALGTKAIAPLVAVLVLAAPAWTGILFPRYPEAGPPAAVIGLAVTIFFASSQTTVLLNAAQHDRTATLAALAGLGVSIIGSFLLAPFGTMGVAWARVAGELTRLSVEAFGIVRDLGVRPGALAAPWVAISPVLIGAAIAVAVDWQPPLLWGAAAVVGLGMAPLWPAIRKLISRSA